MSSVPTLEIPTLETYPVSGEPGAITLQSTHLQSSSHLLETQGQQVSGIASSLAPNWRGEAAGNYQSFSGLVSGAFVRAAAEIGSVASVLLRYAGELESFQRQAKTAEAESKHWHDQITIWTKKLDDARRAVTKAQGDLESAERAYASAHAKGPAGAAAASAANGAITSARTALTTAEHDVTTASKQLRNAHEQFTIWQGRAQRIQLDAKTAGEQLAASLLTVTVIAPPLPGTPDYPPLEPTPSILLNDSGKKGDKGGSGDGEKGGSGDGQGDGEKPKPEYPTYNAWKDKDGKWHISGPDRGDTTATQGDPGEQRRKDERFLQGLQDGKPKEPPSVLIGRILTGA